MLLPLMPSLLSREARAQAASANNKRFIYIGTEHGGASWDNIYGTQGTTGATPVNFWPGSSGQYTPLALTTSGTTSALSPILTAPSTVLTSSIVKKVNVIRGIDFANSVGHHEGAHLGNNNAQVGDRAATISANITIDQLMAYSPNFYSTIPRVRSINIGADRALSWTYTNPSDRTGVQKLQRYSSSVALFNSIFGTTGPATPTRPLIIDRVLDNYKSLSQSNRRLSAADKMRLTDHVGRLTQLQQQLAALTTPLSCGMPTAPIDNASIFNVLNNKGLALDQQNTYYKVMADVLLTAFSCGASRIAVYHDEFPFSTYQGDWHQDIAHQCLMGANQQKIMAASYQQVFEHVFMYLANGLEGIVDADGSTALDNSLMFWGHESGFSTHDPWALPIVMAGKAGGYFKTGMFVDYRNQIPSSQNTNYLNVPGNFAGLIYPQFLATALYSMGVTASEWTSANGTAGYGDYKTDMASTLSFTASGVSTRPDGVYKNAGMPLPIITGA